MGAFRGSLLLRAVRGQWQYTLEEDFAFESSFGLITAPKGLRTDGVSVRWPASLFVNPEDPVIREASIIHDALYAARGAGQLTRRQCDQVLAEAMRASGASRAMVWCVYWAVRIGGASHWPAT